MKNITIAGNVTKDGELRTTQNGGKILGFSIAVNGYANGAKTTDFFDVSIWGKRGEQAQQFAKKGAKMCVSGDLSTREHNGKTYLQVRADNVTILGGGNQGNQGQANRDNDQGYGNQNSGYGAGGSANSGGRDLDDSIPFRMCWEL